MVLHGALRLAIVTGSLKLFVAKKPKELLCELSVEMIVA